MLVPWRNDLPGFVNVQVWSCHLQLPLLPSVVSMDFYALSCKMRFLAAIKMLFGISVSAVAVTSIKNSLFHLIRLIFSLMLHIMVRTCLYPTSVASL